MTDVNHNKKYNLDSAAFIYLVLCMICILFCIRLKFKKTHLYAHQTYERIHSFFYLRHVRAARLLKLDVAFKAKISRSLEDSNMNPGRSVH